MSASNTRMGDDHFHITSTDFTPGVQDIKGISIAKWPPIVTVSGPIKKGKAWYIDALDGEYDNNITKQLPDGADADPAVYHRNGDVEREKPDSGKAGARRLGSFRPAHAVAPIKPDTIKADGQTAANPATHRVP